MVEEASTGIAMARGLRDAMRALSLRFMDGAFL